MKNTTCRRQACLRGVDIFVDGADRFVDGDDNFVDGVGYFVDGVDFLVDGVDRMVDAVDKFADADDAPLLALISSCLLYTSDAADDLTRVALGGRRGS